MSLSVKYLIDLFVFFFVGGKRFDSGKVTAADVFAFAIRRPAFAMFVQHLVLSLQLFRCLVIDLISRVGGVQKQIR